MPAGQPTPSKAQVAAGQDVSGKMAYYSNQQTYPSAGAYTGVTADISGFTPNRYNVYLVCVDTYGNISNIVNFLVSGTYSFELFGHVTFTVTDGADPIEGAEVTVGTETRTTDANGQAVFNLSEGSYTYLVTVAGYSEASGSFDVDAQEKSVPIALEVLIPVTLQSATADGTVNTTTSTKIDLTFDPAIAGLTEDAVIITGGTGAVVKGALTGSGTTWSIVLTSVTTQGNVTVAVSAPVGYMVSVSPKTVEVYKAMPPSISPASVNYDLSAPADITTTITWNSALTVTDVVYGSDYLTIPDAFTVDGDILTIKESYLWDLAPSEGTALEFEITFDTDATASLMVNVVDNYTPANDATLSDLMVGGTTVNGFNSDHEEYDEYATTREFKKNQTVEFRDDAKIEKRRLTLSDDVHHTIAAAFFKTKKNYNFNRGIFYLYATNLLKGVAEMKDNAVIFTQNVNKYFKDFHALKDLSLTVGQGEIFGFIGKNGAGKTTFMRIVCGLMKPSNGTVEVLKRDMSIKSTNVIKSKIGFLPQNVRFHDNVSAQGLIEFFASLRGADMKESIKFASELEVDMKKTVKNLSPGQQRKLQLVIATIGLPELLVLDEPTAGLDPLGVQQLREIIKILNRKGCSIFISSHVLMELDNICSSVAIIEKGEILYQGLFSTVYEIEIEDASNNLVEQLPDDKKGRCDIKGQKLFANIERHEVPELLQFLYEKGIKVFGVKRQGLEAFYNNLVKEGA